MALITAIAIKEYTTTKGEGAFGGPKIEFVLRDVIEDWQWEPWSWF